jgi:hypothetical protein
MKKLFLLLMILTVNYTASAQRECTKKMRKTARKLDTVQVNEKLRTLGISAGTPHMIKLFVVIFANSDGSNIAASQADVRRQITNMANFYAPHDICFALGAIQQVNNTELNSMDADNDEGLLSPYIRTGYITIFVHNSLFNSDGSLNGNAYGIPNYYLSIVGSAVAGTANISTMAHEMGHCFGLYHTFEDAFGEENVARSGGCKDCEDDGDYLCDTQADRDPVSDAFISNDCTYTGSRRDDCGSILLMELQNIMTYGRRSCRDHFTSGQGNRARSSIVSDAELTDATAGDNFTIFLSFTYNDDYKIYQAKNTVTFQASNYVATGTAKVNASARAIVVKAGTQFKPTANNGYAVLRVNPYCQ